MIKIIRIIRKETEKKGGKKMLKKTIINSTINTEVYSLNNLTRLLTIGT